MSARPRINTRKKMGSVVAGSTYLIAPPPKSHNYNHLISAILCQPITHPRLLLQLQRKDRDTRRAFPQFDLVSRRTGRPPKVKSVQNSETSPVSSSCRPREVVVQRSETGEKVAKIKLVHSLTSAQKRKAGIDPNDNSVIAVVYWNYSKSLTKVWTVHSYKSKKKGQKVGYEFRSRSQFVRSRNGNGYVYVRWTKRLAPSSREVRSQSLREERNSVSSIETPKRRNTLPRSTTESPSSAEPKWEFSSPNVRRVMASMTSHKLHIHSITALGTPVSSPSTSDFDDEVHCDRELTTGRMFEMVVISGLFVGFQEDFASILRNEFLSAAGLRIPPPDDRQSLLSEEEIRSLPQSPSPSPSLPSPPKVSTPSTLKHKSTGPKIHSQVPKSPTILSRRGSQLAEPKDISMLTLRTQSIPPTSYTARGWGYMTAAATACATKLMSLGA